MNITTLSICVFSENNFSHSLRIGFNEIVLIMMEVADGIGDGEKQRHITADVDGVRSFACADGLCRPSENNHPVPHLFEGFVLSGRRRRRLAQTVS